MTDRSMPRAARLLLVVAATAGLPAAELVVRDLGISLESPPSGFTYTVSDDAGTRSGSDSFSVPLGIVIGGRYSLAGTGASQGMVLGGGLAADRATSEAKSWSSTAVRGTAGWGWAINDRLVLVGEARLGLGAARLSVEGEGAFASYSASGPLLDLGLQGGAAFALGESVILTGDLGWSRDQARLTGDAADIDLTRSGFGFALGVAWRFSNRPFLLE